MDFLITLEPAAAGTASKTISSRNQSFSTQWVYILISSDEAEYVSDKLALGFAHYFQLHCCGTICRAILRALVEGASHDFELDAKHQGAYVVYAGYYKVSVAITAIPSIGGHYSVCLLGLESFLKFYLAKRDFARCLEVRILQDYYRIILHRNHPVAFPAQNAVLEVVFALTLESRRYEFTLMRWTICGTALVDFTIELSISDYHFCFVDAMLYGNARGAQVSRVNAEYLNDSLIDRLFNGDVAVPDVIQKAFSQFGRKLTDKNAHVKLAVSAYEPPQKYYVAIARKMAVFMREAADAAFYQISVKYGETIQETTFIGDCVLCVHPNDRFIYADSTQPLYDYLPEVVQIYCADLGQSVRYLLEIKKYDLGKLLYYQTRTFEIQGPSGTYTIIYEDAFAPPSAAPKPPKQDAWAMMFGQQNPKKGAQKAVVLKKRYDEEIQPLSINFTEVDAHLRYLELSNRDACSQSTGKLSHSRQESTRSLKSHQNQTYTASQQSYQNQRVERYIGYNMTNYYKIVADLKRETSQRVKDSVRQKTQQITTRVNPRYRMIQDLDDDLRRVNHIKYREQFNIRSLEEIKQALYPYEEFIDINKLTEHTVFLPDPKEFESSANSTKSSSPKCPQRRYVAGTTHLNIQDQFTQTVIEELRTKQTAVKPSIYVYNDNIIDSRLYNRVAKLVAKISKE